MPKQPNQGSHHYIVTLSAPSRNGMVMGTFHGTLTPDPEETRYDVFKTITESVANDNPEYASGHVMYYSLEPNKL